jgi:predicted transcriptional regulator
MKANRLVHPQEIEVWYILPALRKELAKSMKEEGTSQKEIARLLGLSEGAVSYYSNGLRANRIKFGDKTLIEIKKSSKRIINGKSNLIKEIRALVNLEEVKELVCKLHRQNGGAAEDCRICFN